MDEEKKEELPQAETEEKKPPYTPASRSKRIAAWVGIILMVLLVILYSYSIATGSFLNR